MKVLKQVFWTFVLFTLVLGLMLAWAERAFLPQKGWEQSASPLTALATTLYWEAALEEPEQGLRAIAWAVFNRVESKDFPNTVLEVVSDGAAGKLEGGCQFSFNCDGRLESPRILCELKSLPEATCDMRWVHYLVRSALMLVLPGEDPTGGAAFYWVGPEPYWARDLVPQSRCKIGSHTFARSKYMGEDLPHTKSICDATVAPLEPRAAFNAVRGSFIFNTTHFLADAKILA